MSSNKPAAEHSTLAAFELLDEIFDLPAEERERILKGRDPAVVAEVRAMLDGEDPEDSFLSPATPTEVPMSVVDPATGEPRQLGPYRLLEVLGEGGMGRVFLAEQSQPVKRRVALKILRFAIASDEMRARFNAERHAMGRLDHPNIGKLLEAGTTDQGVPFFAMELINGEPITDHCDLNFLSIEDRLEIFADVCRGTAHAHSRMILHRDLKPSNVLVTEIDGRPFPKIIDFGIAKGMGESLSSATLATRDGLVGTPAYMSPEAIGLGGEVDARSDVFSLGILLYQLLAGVLPWSTSGPSPAAVLKERMETEAGAPSTRVTAGDPSTREEAALRRGLRPADLSRRLRGDLDWIVMKATAKDPDQRYPSAGALADDVGRYLRDEPVSARPPTAAYLIRQLVRRHRPIFIGAAVAVLAVMLGIVGTSIGLVRARQAERRAVAEAEAARQAQSEVKQVADFLVDLFEINDPGETLGNTVTARELLDRGAAEIRTRLADQPLTRARMMDTIAVAYRQLVLPQPAVPLIEEALELRQLELGSEHPDTVASLVELGRLYWLAGRYPEAQATLEEALAQRQRALGPEHPEVAEVLDHLGSVYGTRASWEAAQTAFTRALAIREAAFGSDSAEAAASLDDLGVLLLDQSEFAEAAVYLRRALAIRERILGPEHPEVATTCNGLAIALSFQGELEAAQELNERALAIREKVFGADSPDVAQSLTNLASIYLDRGFPERAESALLRALDIWERQLGPEHRRLGVALFNLGDVRRQRGDLEAAEASYRRTLAIFETSLGPEHPNVALAAHNLAMVLRDRGQTREAESLFRRALALRLSIYGAGHDQVTMVREEYAQLLRATGRDAEAEEMLAGAEGQP